MKLGGVRWRDTWGPACVRVSPGSADNCRHTPEMPALVNAFRGGRVSGKLGFIRYCNEYNCIIKSSSSFICQYIQKWDGLQKNPCYKTGVYQYQTSIKLFILFLNLSPQPKVMVIMTWLKRSISVSLVGTSVSCDTADHHQKENSVTTGVMTHIWFFSIFF